MRNNMRKTYRIYFRYILKGLSGIFRLLLIHLLRSIYKLIMWIVNGVKQHKLRTAVTCIIALAGLNLWQLVYYKTERMKVEQRCDSLYTKSLATKSYYDKGYQDGLKFNYKLQ